MLTKLFELIDLIKITREYADELREHVSLGQKTRHRNVKLHGDSDRKGKGSSRAYQERYNYRIEWFKQQAHRGVNCYRRDSI